MTPETALPTAATPPAGEDPEIRAIVALRAALEPLDHHAVARVLKWADHRYGDGKLLDTSRALLASLNEALQATCDAADRLKITPAEMSAAADRVLLEATNRKQATA